MYHPGARGRKSAEDGYHDPPIIQYEASGLRVGARGVRVEVELSEVEVAGVAEALAIATAAAEPLDPRECRWRASSGPAATDPLEAYTLEAMQVAAQARAPRPGSSAATPPAISGWSSR